jgi:hypothetical protein
MEMVCSRVARALVTAYQQALVNSAKQGGSVAPSGAARVARGIIQVERPPGYSVSAEKLA